MTTIAWACGYVVQWIWTTCLRLRRALRKHADDADRAFGDEEEDGGDNSADAGDAGRRPGVPQEGRRPGSRRRNLLRDDPIGHGTRASSAPPSHRGSFPRGVVASD